VEKTSDNVYAFFETPLYIFELTEILDFYCKKCNCKFFTTVCDGRGILCSRAGPPGRFCSATRVHWSLVGESVRKLGAAPP